ncbi:MAG: CdaR family protein [Vicinamibacterales bacterium]
MAYHPFRHLGLKVVALALATLLWLSVAGEHIVERIIRVPLEFRNIPPQLEVVGDPPSTVDVRLRGSSALLSRLEAGEVVAVLDLANARPGSRLFHIRNDEVRSPYGVEVTQVVPGTLGIEFEKSARRVIPVVAPVEGDPQPGFVVGPVTAEPATVEVIGPQSRLKKLAQATTEPVSVDGARQNVRDVVAVGVTDSAVRLVKPQDVTVIVSVVPAPVERELSHVLVRGRNLGDGLQHKVTPEAVTVTVRGRRDELTGMRPEMVDAFVDLDGLGAGRYNLRVQVDPSQQFGVTMISPQNISVTIK